VSASVSGMNLTGSGFTQQFECRAALELQARFFNGRVVSDTVHCALTSWHYHRTDLGSYTKLVQWQLTLILMIRVQPYITCRLQLFHS
jgi:hypothetical protein